MLYVYHNTSKDNAENIRKTGVMSAKEDGIFVSTKPDGQSEFDISSDIRYNEIKGKSFLLIDDNSTTGRTFKGLEGFIEDNGDKVVGYYAMTTGQDMSEKMITTDETQKKVERIGIGKIRGFAESEGIRREISRNGLTERETRELIRQYRKKVDKRRTNSFLSKKGGTKAEIQRVYENGRRDSEKDRTRGKFLLKSSNSSNLDTGENNTDNVQIEIDGNEDFIDNIREKLYNEETKKIDTSTEGFTAWVEDIQSGRGVYNSNNVDDTESISNRNDDRLYDKSRKSNTRRTAIQSNGNQQIEGEILLKGLKDLQKITAVKLLDIMQ